MKSLKFALLVLTSFVLSSCGVEQVDTGFRGVKTRFGSVVSDPLVEGLYFYNPITTRIIEMDTRTQKWSARTEAYTKDVQQVTINFTVNYAPEKNKVHLLFQNVGMTWADRLVPQIVEGSLKAVVGTYNAVDLIENRQKATQDAENLIAEKALEKFVLIEKLEFNNLKFEDEFEKAVEAKVVAIQRAAEAKNKTVEIEEKARQKIISSKAEAESMRIRANALTQNRSLVEYEAIQKWNGKLPEYVLGNSMPFIDVTPAKRK